MLHHVSVGVRDVARASEFYDAVMASLKYKKVTEMLPLAIAYGDKEPSFWVQLPRGQQELTIGNGAHVTFVAKTKKAVDAFYEAALAAGGTDDGAPGERPEYGDGYYAAFVIDPYGNRLEAAVVPDASKKKRTKRGAAKTSARKVSAKAEKAPKATKGKKAGRKASAKKVAAKTAVKKAGKKATAKKAPAKAAKKPARKAATKKTPVKKAVKKTVGRKPAAPKTAVIKTTAKKKAVRKTAAKKTAVKKVAAKKAPAKKTAKRGLKKRLVRRAK